MLVGRRQQRFDLDQIARKDSLRVPVSGQFPLPEGGARSRCEATYHHESDRIGSEPPYRRTGGRDGRSVALAQRADPLTVLLACLSQPASVGEIATRANLPRGLASHHLRLLRAGRFLRTTPNGKQIIYEPRDERVFCILSDLIGHIVKPAADDDE